MQLPVLLHIMKYLEAKMSHFLLMCQKIVRLIQNRWLRNKYLYISSKLVNIKSKQLPKKKVLMGPMSIYIQ